MKQSLADCEKCMVTTPEKYDIIKGIYFSGVIFLNFKANSGVWGTMFGVPCIVADNLLKLATGDQLKVLLYLLRCSGRDCTDEEISQNTGVSPQQAAEAVMFWQQVNVLSQDTASVSSGGIMSMNCSQPSVPEITPVKPVDNTEKKAVQPKRNQNLPPSEISKLMKDSADISELLKTAEGLLGSLTHTQQNSLIWMYSYLGLKKEVIITLLAYCISIDKTNSAYIEKIACSWSDNEINTLDAAQEEVSRLTESMEYFGKIKKMFNMNRNPTANEKEIIWGWKNSGYNSDLIFYAYEIALEKINKLSFKYINSILENWKKNGYMTVRDVKVAESSFKKSKNGGEVSEDNDFDVDKYKEFINNF